MTVDAIKGKSAPLRTIGVENNEIRLLEKQKAQLQETIQKISAGKEDLKTKQEKTKELQSQIDEIDAMIQQKRSEKLNSMNSTNKAENVDPSETKKDGIRGSAVIAGNEDVFEQSGLLQATATYAQVKTMMHVKKELVNRGNILKVEIAFDERSGGTATMKRAELAKLDKQEKKIEKKASETLKQAQEEVASDSERGKTETEKSRHDDSE